MEHTSALQLNHTYVRTHAHTHTQMQTVWLENMGRALIVWSLLTVFQTLPGKQCKPKKRLYVKDEHKEATDMKRLDHLFPAWHAPCLAPSARPPLPGLPCQPGPSDLQSLPGVPASHACHTLLVLGLPDLPGLPFLAWPARPACFACPAVPT